MTMARFNSQKNSTLKLARLAMMIGQLEDQMRLGCA
ncbi:predicted protein [Sclerotinia sclerotiorum 1980 UF-70]|uniref:Uncharacterized protein n=1 Tax=Sclerotinia sclerotiorum (strain ATCC 18683 / 1980 / Ss-1) TaxID=665079 RepID=A7EAX4_SCLS1|nr:predicted protein [Sclerotinia sclerotiorum 1980 UF-70]EDN99602.1 predicted protein [Sclerotinia sclerotiorum 1980 UF-70]